MFLPKAGSFRSVFFPLKARMPWSLGNDGDLMGWSQGWSQRLLLLGLLDGCACAVLFLLLPFFAGGGIRKGLVYWKASTNAFLGNVTTPRKPIKNVAMLVQSIKERYPDEIRVDSPSPASAFINLFTQISPLTSYFSHNLKFQLFSSLI